MARNRRVRDAQGHARQARRTWFTEETTAATNAGDTGSRSTGNARDKVQRRMGKPIMMSKLSKRLYRGSSARAHPAVRLLTILAMLLAILAPLAEISPAHAAGISLSAT